jgi:polyisoprenoid-binding protein YceI
MTKYRSSFLALAVVCILPAVAGAALSRSGTPNVQFTAIGVAGLKIVGTTHELDLREDGGNVVVSVPLANLDTGIGLRNQHMREKYLEVAKYPRAELTVVRNLVNVPVVGADSSGAAAGTMLIHGVSRPVQFKYRAKRDGAGIHVTGSVHLNMKDHGISVPSYLGVTVKPDVDVDVTFDVNE